MPLIALWFSNHGYSEDNYMVHWYLIFFQFHILHGPIRNMASLVSSTTIQDVKFISIDICQESFGEIKLCIMKCQDNVLFST